MGDYAYENELKINDKIVFDDMIHYTMVKTSTFNGVPHPSIGIWKEDNTFQLIREIGYEMFKNKLSQKITEHIKQTKTLFLFEKIEFFWRFSPFATSFCARNRFLIQNPF